jgi:asparagine synthase (glutamine-hydrolysing)
MFSVEGGMGRALARRAFAERLPQVIAQRRSKADMTAFYGKGLAAALARVRPFLIEGRLAAQGLVDPTRLDHMLQVESLIHEGRYGDLYDLIAIEAWVRTWESRLAALDYGVASPSPMKGRKNAKASS